MTLVAVRRAKPWFEQAASDLRAATALLERPPEMQLRDVGCHVAAMCAQSVEKSIKGYLFLNDVTPARNHRPDKLLPTLLSGVLLRYNDHQGKLSNLFDPPTRAVVRKLLDLTPGGLGNGDFPNTEYPWTDAAGDELAPVNALHVEPLVWLAATKRISDMLRKLLSAVERATSF